jgi:hypothetical protein
MRISETLQALLMNFSVSYFFSLHTLVRIPILATPASQTLHVQPETLAYDYSLQTLHVRFV